MNGILICTSSKTKGHSDSDAALVHIATKTGEGKRVEVANGVEIHSTTKAPLVQVIMSESTKPLHDVLIANEVLIFGSPTSIGVENFPQIDPLRPLLRKGIGAGKNNDLKTIILDCPSYPGNSGGPVLEIEEEGLASRFRVIGVISQFVPVAETWLNTTYGYTNVSMEHFGYSVATPMDFVYELVNEFQENASTSNASSTQ